MNNRFCIPRSRTRSDWGVIKFYKDGTEQWFEIWPPPTWTARQTVLMPVSLLTTEQKHNCNECKHNFACMVQLDCNRTFESKV